jgi:hypothetical protein
LLKRPKGVGTWTYLDIPPEVAGQFETKGQFKVRGAINGAAFRSTALPHGDGTHYLVIGASIRSRINAKVGDTVSVSLEPDSEPRVVEVPPDLVKALDGSPAAQAAFDGIPPSHQREFLEYIESAKKAETRRERIAKTLDMLVEKKYPKRKV